MPAVFPRLLALSVLLFAAVPAQAQDRKDLRILRITPEGENASSVRQIVIEFNRAVVPIGEMKRTAEEVGVTITPPVSCEWRWLNTTSLSCNLGEKDSLQPATAYSMTVQPVIKAEDGAAIAETYEHKFATMRPAIENIFMKTWKGPGEPVLRANFNQPVTASSLQKALGFETWDGPVVASRVERDEDDKTEPVKKDGEDARTVWLVSPGAELPLNRQIKLKMAKGLVSAAGDLTGVANDDIKQFYTYPEFAFRGVICRDKNNNEVILTLDIAQREEELCNPLQPVSLAFTAPVLRSQVKDHVVFSPGLAGGRADYNPWGDEDRDWSRLYEDRSLQDIDYRIGLPVGLKAAQKYTLSVAGKKPSLWQRIKAVFTGEVLLPVSALTDEFGRTLPPFTLHFATGHRNPNYELVYRDAVLEKGVDSDVPVYVNNLQDFAFDYNSVTSGAEGAGTTETTDVPQVEDVQFAMPGGVRDMLGGKSGAVYARLKTTPEVQKWDMANRLFAQVTPYQLYTKLGHFRSSVWVTDLATGAPVADAKVTIYKGELMGLSQPEGTLATAQTDKDGVAFLPGLSELDPDLSMLRSYNDSDTRMFVRVDKGEDMALLPVSYEYEVQLWNVASDIYPATNEKYGHMKAWGMTAQGIYRAGDTMQYKIYIRDQDNNRFIAPPDAAYTLDITDPTGKSVQRLENIDVTEFGTVAGEYKIPENSAVGFYSFKLEAKLKVSGKDVVKEFYPLSVLVSDFTPAPFRVTTELNGDNFKAGDTLDIMADAKLHSGGPYGEAAIRSTVTLKSRAFSSKNPAAKGYYFDSFEEETDTEDLAQKEEKLNDKGEWKTSFTLPEKQIVYGRLIVESAVRDERGKSIAASAQADYVGVDRLVGLMPTQWVYESKKPAIVKTIVVDPKGEPVDKVPVDLVIEKEEVVTAKVKGAGNAYLGDNTVEWKKVADCKVKSTKEGEDCAFTPDSAGSYRITANIKDTKGREHTTKQYLWVTGGDYVHWNEGRENALTILPEKNDYKVGETARYLVKNPWPGVTAFISVERYGVIDTFVQKLEGSAPVIEIPVKPDYVPGFFVSIVAVSPRVDAPPPEFGQIDMGKPAFRVGYVQTDVLDPYKMMSVTAKADQEVYRPRDTVKVSLSAKPLNAPETREPVELAVAVLDESVFDLIAAGRDAYDPYKGFYSLDNLDVANYSLMMRLVGRQKFEKKGANPGGDGGIDAGMRNIFKFVSYWNPSVPVNADGTAEIEFEAPDNLTGWRILALASTPNDRMGLGDANFKVNRPTEIRPVMPNQVREGDEFSAGFSVMNRTDKPRTIKISISATGDLKDSKPQLKEEALTLEPYKRATILMPLTTALLPATRDIQQGKIAFSVTAGDESDSDGLEHSIPLLKSRTLQTSANYGTTTESSAHETIAIPKDIFTDTGDISVVLSPSVISGLDGAFRYMRDYSYPCWEQKLTMAVMAAHYSALKGYLDEGTLWEGSEKLPQELIDIAASYQAPNGGMAYFLAQDNYADPYLSAYTALAFGWLKQYGYKIPPQVEAGLEKYLMNFLRNKSAPDYYQDGMTSTVRAVILAAYKDSGRITKNDILRFRPYVKNMSLFGKAYYLQAAGAFPETKDAARETFNMILSSGVESSGKFSFNETWDDGYDRILATPLRDNCAVLSSLLSYDSDLVGDKPFKLVRMITQSRGNRDHFENTQENMFCMNALASYARLYESEEPDMRVVPAFEGKAFGAAEFTDVKDKPVTLSRPLEEGDVGKKGKLNIARDGEGRLYYTTRLRYAAKDLKDAVNAGIDIRREYSVKKDGKWALVSSPLKIRRGDLVKVDLFLSLPTARNFVVVDDPLPGGLETVNRDLATASTVDADQALFDEAGGSYWFKFTDWKEYAFSRWSFYHKELRHDSARFYADWLEPGNYHLSYMAQAIAAGSFSAPPVKAEEMYDPDVYGLGVKGEILVGETP